MPEALSKGYLPPSKVYPTLLTWSMDGSCKRAFTVQNIY